jgi:hypothetical protein
MPAMGHPAAGKGPGRPLLLYMFSFGTNVSFFTHLPGPHQFDHKVPSSFGRIMIRSFPKTLPRFLSPFLLGFTLALRESHTRTILHVLGPSEPQFDLVND